MRHLVSLPSAINLSSTGYFCRLKGANSSHPIAADSNRVKTGEEPSPDSGLLDRTFAAATDEDITDLVGALDEDHMEALTELVGGEPDALKFGTVSADASTARWKA